MQSTNSEYGSPCHLTFFTFTKLYIFLCIYTFWGILCLLLLDRTVECRQESIGWRERSGIGKGPRDGTQTLVAVSTFVLWSWRAGVLQSLAPI